MQPNEIGNGLVWTTVNELHIEPNANIDSLFFGKSGSRILQVQIRYIVDRGIRCFNPGVELQRPGSFLQRCENVILAAFLCFAIVTAFLFDRLVRYLFLA